MEFNIRKVILLKEEIFYENGPVQTIPRLRAAAIAIVANPMQVHTTKICNQEQEILRSLV